MTPKKVFQVVQLAIKSCQGFWLSRDAERLESDQVKWRQWVKKIRAIGRGRSWGRRRNLLSCIDACGRTWLLIVLLQHLARRSLLEGNNKRNKVTSSGLFNRTSETSSLSLHPCQHGEEISKTSHEASTASSCSPFPNHKTDWKEGRKEKEKKQEKKPQKSAKLSKMFWCWNVTHLLFCKVKVNTVRSVP